MVCNNPDKFSDSFYLPSYGEKAYFNKNGVEIGCTTFKLDEIHDFIEEFNARYKVVK